MSQQRGEGMGKREKKEKVSFGKIRCDRGGGLSHLGGEDAGCEGDCRGERPLRRI